MNKKETKTSQVENLKQPRYYIFGHSDYIKYSLTAILQEENVRYVDFFSADPSLVRLLLSRKIPCSLKVFFWKMFSRHMRGLNFLEAASSKDVFILYEKNYFSRDKAFLSYLRKRSPCCKIVFVVTNLISELWKKNNPDTYEMITATGNYDEVVTFNKPDADKYGFSYFQFVNSKYVVEGVSDAPESDVFFCGKDKGRGEKVEQIFNVLTEGGLKCNFILIADETTNKDYKGGIRVLKHPVQNKEVLQNMLKSKCILDIAFDRTSSGQSLRFSEAIAYEKLLLIDNPFTASNELFHSGQMIVFNNADELNPQEIVDKFSRKDFLSAEVVSPKNLLKFVSNS